MTQLNCKWTNKRIIHNTQATKETLPALSQQTIIIVIIIIIIIVSFLALYNNRVL